MPIPLSFLANIRRSVNPPLNCAVEILLLTHRSCVYFIYLAVSMHGQGLFQRKNFHIHHRHITLACSCCARESIIAGTMIFEQKSACGLVEDKVWAAAQNCTRYRVRHAMVQPPDTCVRNTVISIQQQWQRRRDWPLSDDNGVMQGG